MSKGILADPYAPAHTARCHITILIYNLGFLLLGKLGSFVCLPWRGLNTTPQNEESGSFCPLRIPYGIAETGGFLRFHKDLDNYLEPRYVFIA